MPQHLDPVDTLGHGHRERRMRRFPDPPCDGCGSDQIAVTLRTEMAIYYRCPACALIFALPKPGVRRYHPAPPDR